jgi:hypothetical protein
MEERRDTHRVLVGKAEGKRPLGRHTHRWENNIKMYIQQIGRGAWTGLIWLIIGTSSGPCEHVAELSGSIKCGQFLD